MDNIGGIISAEYFFATDLKSCCVTGTGILLSLSAGKSWKEIPATPGKIEITVTPAEDNGLTSYNVNGTIYCASGKMDNPAERIQLKTRKILLKYTTGNGFVYVAGDKENPLKVLLENITPSTASGYSGTKITITGSMKHAELPLL